MSEPPPDELATLQSPENWDWEHVQRGTPTPHAGISYRVRFHSDEVHTIGDAARAQGISEIEFIHQAALDAARKVRRAGR